MRAIGYARISRRAEDGASLGAQERAIDAACRERGWMLDRVYRETASARRGSKRPKLERAVAAVEDGADALIVARLDRLSRSVSEFGLWIERAEANGWGLVLLEPALDLTEPAGRMIANVLATFAQFERELISARTKAALDEKRRQGIRPGRPSALDPATAQRIRNLHSRGHPIREIARRLNEDTTPTAQGGSRWWPSTVRGVLQGWHPERRRE